MTTQSQANTNWRFTPPDAPAGHVQCTADAPTRHDTKLTCECGETFATAFALGMHHATAKSAAIRAERAA